MVELLILILILILPLLFLGGKGVEKCVSGRASGGRFHVWSVGGKLGQGRGELEKVGREVGGGPMRKVANKNPHQLDNETVIRRSHVAQVQCRERGCMLSIRIDHEYIRLRPLS